MVSPRYGIAPPADLAWTVARGAGIQHLERGGRSLARAMAGSWMAVRRDSQGPAADHGRADGPAIRRSPKARPIPPKHGRCASHAPSQYLATALRWMHRPAAPTGLPSGRGATAARRAKEQDRQSASSAMRARFGREEEHAGRLAVILARVMPKRSTRPRSSCESPARAPHV